MEATCTQIHAVFTEAAKELGIAIQKRWTDTRKGNGNEYRVCRIMMYVGDAGMFSVQPAQFEQLVKLIETKMQQLNYSNAVVATGKGTAHYIQCNATPPYNTMT